MAWKTEAKANDLLLLLAICDFANDEGVLYPSKAKIFQKAKVSTSTGKYIMGAFEDIGLIRSQERFRENGSQTSNMMQIDIGILEKFNYQDFKKAYQARRKYTPKREQKPHYDSYNHNEIVTPLNRLFLTVNMNH
jgi:hypothetical protein